MAARLSALVVGVVLILTACTATGSVSPSASGGLASSPTVSGGPSASTSSTPAPTPTASPAPAGSFSLLPVDPPAGFHRDITCDGKIGATDSVALVEIRGGSIVLRDYADPAHPRTACRFGERPPQLIDARHVLITDCSSETGGCQDAVVDLPEVRYHWFQLPRSEEFFPELLAISPKLDEIAWVRSAATGERRNLILTRADGNHRVARLRPAYGRCGSIEDSKLADYTMSADLLWVLDVPIAPDATFLVLAGDQPLLRMRPPEGGWPEGRWPAFPVWTPDGSSLFLRRGALGLHWTPIGGLEPFPAAANWRWPTISPDGHYLAFARPRDDGRHDVYLMDLRAGSAPRLIGHNRMTPAFLNNGQLWYRRDSGGGCVGELQRPLVYDVASGTEAASIINTVFGAWPATSSNY